MKKFQKYIPVGLLLVLICIIGYHANAAEKGDTYYLRDDGRIVEELEKNVRMVAKVKSDMVISEELLSYDSATDTVTVNGINAKEFTSYCSKIYIKSDSVVGTYLPKTKVTIDGATGKKLVYGKINNPARLTYAEKVYNDNAGNIYVNSMSISGTNTIFAKGSGSTTVFTVNSTMKAGEVTWSSNSSDVLVYQLGNTGSKKTSADNGQVQIVSNCVGSVSKTVRITATASDGSSAYRDLIIKPSTISLNLTTATIFAAGSGSSFKLQATVNGVPVTSGVTWTSSQEACAKVENGVVTGNGTAGTIDIKAAANDVDTSCRVEVKTPTIALNTSAMSLYSKGSGTTGVLQATVNGVPVTSGVTWKSSDAAYATVANGTVTGKKAGTVRITATANGVSAVCTVTVKAPTIVLSSTGETIYYKITNKTVKLSATVNGVTTNSGVTWSSNKPAVATVNEYGKVTGKSAGTAKITATANGVSRSCTIEVKDSKLTITSKLTVAKGKTGTIAVKVNGVEYDASEITWSSSDKTVATVSKKGVVTGKAKGTATITATFSGMTDKCTVTVTK